MDFARILVATDFSEGAEQALRSALTLARHNGARITLLYVCEPPAFSTPELSMYVPSPEETHDQIAEAVRGLDAICRRYANSGVAIEARWRIGHPADEIVRFADENQSDLVVVGSHGRRGWRRLMLGSVAERVVRTAKVPVLTVHADEPAHAAASAEAQR